MFYVIIMLSLATPAGFQPMGAMQRTETFTTLEECKAFVGSQSFRKETIDMVQEMATANHLPLVRITAGCSDKPLETDEPSKTKSETL
jgi:hypothetical protein